MAKKSRASGKAPRKTARRRAAPEAAAADEGCIGGFCPCTANFFSPLQRRVLPEPVARTARADGLAVGGTVAAGFSPGTFSFSPPGRVQAGVLVNDATWGPGAALNVSFLDRPPPGVGEKVERYAAVWSEACGVTFRFGAAARGAHVRVTFARPGFWSLLGMEGLQAPHETMALGFRGNEPEEEVRRLVLHEFGHALGWMHEHQHPASGIEWDPDGAFAVFGRGLPPGMTREQVLAQLFAVPANSFRYKFFPFDPDSIMLYRIPPEAIRPGRYRPEYGKNNTTLSQSDKDVARQVYGPSKLAPPPVVGPGGPRVLAVDGPPLSDSIDSDGEVDEFVFDAPALGRYVVTVLGDALVHVDIRDASGNPPFAGDRGEDSTSPSVGLTMLRLLDPGRQTVRLTGSRFAAGFARGTYTIRVTRPV